MSAVPKVKDYVINIVETQKEVTKKREQQRKVPQCTYDVVLQNNIDFVINRKTSTTDKDLVFLVSQSLFYIKDNKTELVENLNEAKLRSFFQNIYYDKLTMLDKVQWWGNSTPKNNLEKMAKLTRDEALQKMYQHNIFPSEYEKNQWKVLFDENVKLFKYCHDKIINSNSKSNMSNVMKLAVSICKEINYNNATYFIDKLAESNIIFNLSDNGYYNNNFHQFLAWVEKYNLNFNRYVEYLLFDLYSQGVTYLENTILTAYKDYLDMQISLFGHIKEKYPKYLKTEHDIIALKVSIYAKHKKDLLLLNVAENHKDLEYKGKAYSIILPQNSMDIVDEGINLSHCVASYVDSVAENKKLILFLRRTSELDKSLVTIEVVNNVVTQAAGFANRGLTEDEIKFLRKWIKEKKLYTNVYKEKEEDKKGE